MTVFYRKRTTPKIDKKWQILSKKGVFTWTLSIFKEKKGGFCLYLSWGIIRKTEALFA